MIFLSFSYVAYLTPMQCDDFWYFDIGLKLQDHIHHYLHWSGRVIADYFSCALLQIPSHLVTSAIIAFFITGICYLITKIPTLIDSNFKVTWWKLIVIAALYWIANPQIEDSTFWVVGACNYVVTTFFVLLFLYFLLRKDQSLSLCTIILALVAGCSNEHTCLAIIYTMFVLWLISHYKRINSLTVNIKLNKKFFFICFALFTIGALILLCAPGNFERTKSVMHQEWCKLSLIEKIDKFINESEYRFPRMIIAVRFYFLMLILTGISWEKNRRELSWSLLFFSTSLVSYIVMVASPYFPHRSLNPTLCFLLVAISCLLNFNLLRYRVLKIILATAITWILWLFIKFFLLLSAGHQIIMVQDAIRIAHIKHMREKKGKSITVDIPQHHISAALRRYGISFPFEFIPYGLEATWNGVNKLNHIRVRYDYSILKTGKNISVDNQTELKDVKIYFQSKSWLVPQSTILLESSVPIGKDLILCYENGENQGEIGLIDQSIELQNKYYVGVTTECDLNLKKVVLKRSESNPK